MSESVLIIGPHRQIHDLFDPLWAEMDLEKQRFSSADAALKMMQDVDPPSAVLVSYPLWDSSLDDLLAAMRRSLSSDQPVPVVILAPEKMLFEVAVYEDQGVTVLSEDKDPEELRQFLGGVLGGTQRAHPRFIVRMAVRVGAGSVLRACQSEDVSLSGMLIRTSEEFPIGSEVRLEFSLQEDQEPIVCQAEVVRYTQPNVEETRGMGVHFLAFEEDGRERLEELFNS